MGRGEAFGGCVGGDARERGADGGRSSIIEMSHFGQGRLFVAARRPPLSSRMRTRMAKQQANAK